MQTPCKSAIEDTITVTEKVVKVNKPQTINSCWRKLCSDFMHDFTGFTTKPFKEIMEEMLEIAKKVVVGGDGFQDMDLSAKKLTLLNCGAGEDLRVSWTAGRSNQVVLKEINPEYSLEGLVLKVKLQNLGHLM